MTNEYIASKTRMRKEILISNMTELLCTSSDYKTSRFKHVLGSSNIWNYPVYQESFQSIQTLTVPSVQYALVTCGHSGNLTVTNEYIASKTRKRKEILISKLSELLCTSSVYKTSRFKDALKFSTETALSYKHCQ